MSHKGATADRGQIEYQGKREGERVILFHVSGQGYALTATALDEIVPLPLLTRPMGSPPLLVGFLNLGGVVVPVVSLARLFGLREQPPGLYTPLLVVRQGAARVALVVDAVRGIVSLDQATLAPLSQGYCWNECARGVFHHNQQHIVLLDEDRLLAQQEARRLEELATLQQQRLANLQEAVS